MKKFTTKKILNVILHNSAGVIDLLLPQLFPGVKVTRV